MKASLLLLSLLLSLLLFSTRPAWAQQPAAGADTARMERYVYRPVANQMLTAADSARERARKENARQLRKKGTDNPAHAPMAVPKQSTNVPLTGSPEIHDSPQPSQSVLNRDARRREEAAREAAENEKKRAKPLNKRARKSS